MALSVSMFSMVKPDFRGRRMSRISASISEKAPSSTTPSPSTTTKFPVVEVPGGYGLPFVGAVADRLNYFWFQGKEEFFKSRIQRYQSTVFRTNMPPGPFIADDPRVVVLLDGASFPVLFDVDKVEKRNLFTGTYMPSTELTGGFRTVSYLDPSEESHQKIKRFIFSLLKSRRDKFIPEFRSAMAELFTGIESTLATKGKAEFNSANQQACFNYLSRAFLGRDPTAPGGIGTDGPSIIKKWVLLQLGPLLSVGLPKPLEELLLHTFPLPPVLVKRDYERLLAYFRTAGSAALDEAEALGIGREEACNNLLFTICFNTYGGMTILFPNIVKWLARAGPKVHRELVQEIRQTLGSSPSASKITPAALERMPLVCSAVYEVLRIEPPVSTQYGKAKRDMVLESHTGAFRIRAGDMLCGYQPFATRDARIFDDPESFVADRFVGPDKDRLLRHVLWSNGRETDEPTESNKQCAGKDLMVLLARLLLVEIFLRYESFDIEVATAPLGSTITITSLRRNSPA
ncbi:Allene oxide synthase [Nymphaea thermarum]|nr:Allene oxide synthase [Nymphaea thermarum]